MHVCMYVCNGYRMSRTDYPTLLTRRTFILKKKTDESEWLVTRMCNWCETHCAISPVLIVSCWLTLECKYCTQISLSSLTLTFTLTTPVWGSMIRSTSGIWATRFWQYSASVVSGVDICFFSHPLWISSWGIPWNKFACANSTGQLVNGNYVFPVSPFSAASLF